MVFTANSLTLLLVAMFLIAIFQIGSWVYFFKTGKDKYLLLALMSTIANILLFHGVYNG